MAQNREHLGLVPPSSRTLCLGFSITDNSSNFRTQQKFRTGISDLSSNKKLWWGQKKEVDKLKLRLIFTLCFFGSIGWRLLMFVFWVVMTPYRQEKKLPLPVQKLRSRECWGVRLRKSWKSVTLVILILNYFLKNGWKRPVLIFKSIFLHGVLKIVLTSTLEFKLISITVELEMGQYCAYSVAYQWTDTFKRKNGQLDNIARLWGL